MFQKGNQLAKGRGRPKKSKNILPMIRDSVLNEAYRRIKTKQFFDDIPNVEFIRFVEKVLPKENTLKIQPDIQYITNTPRPQVENDVTQVIEAQVKEDVVDKWVKVIPEQANEED